MKALRSVMIVVFGIGLIASLVGWVYTRNSLFRLSELNVTTESPDLAREVRQDLVDLLGQRLSSISLSSAETAIRRNPRVKRAIFSKSWPSTLVVVVEERKSVAMAFFNGVLWALDEKGRQIEVVKTPEPVTLLKGFALDTPPIERVCAWLAASKLFEQVDEIDWSNERGVVVQNFDEHFEIELGFDDFANAWRRADLALGVLKNKNISISLLDATYRQRVVAQLSSKGTRKLQNFGNGINSSELVRRKEKDPAPARDFGGGFLHESR